MSYALPVYVDAYSGFKANECPSQGYDEETDEWTLQSGFDGEELLARPGIKLVTVDAATALKAEQLIESCEHCHPDDAEIPFDWILADVTGKRGPYEFILNELARCPNCKHAVTEKTLIEPKGRLRSGLKMRLPGTWHKKQAEFVPMRHGPLIDSHLRITD